MSDPPLISSTEQSASSPPLGAVKKLVRLTIDNRRYIGVVVGYICAYVALDWVSYIYPVAPPLAITPWNPPPGLSLALLLRRACRNTPWLFVAAFIAD